MELVLVAGELLSLIIFGVGLFTMSFAITIGALAGGTLIVALMEIFYPSWD